MTINDQQFRESFRMPAGQMFDANHNRVPVAALREMSRDRLQKIVDGGRANASRVVERILGETPEDRIVQARRVTPLVAADGRMGIEVGDVRLGLHSNAAGQLLEHVGLPRDYADRLALADVMKDNVVETSNEWRRDLLRHNLRTLLEHSGQRYLVRSVGNQARGILSDKYRRLDSRPLFESFVGACNDVGALPVEGLGGELKMSVRAIVPQVYEPVEGECMVFGLSWTNSDYGAGTYSISAFAMRLVCINGLVSESALKQIHLGGRLPDNLVFSTETYRKDTETMVSATGDVVRSVLSPESLSRRVAAITASAGKEVEIDSVLRSVGKRLTKGEAEFVKNAFDGSDAVMLPAGKTQWRAVQALGWLANNVESQERKIELQAIAGQLAA